MIASIRSTLRARLTLVYGGLLLVAGAVLLGLTWLLVEQRLPEPVRISTAEAEHVPSERTGHSESDAGEPSIRPPASNQPAVLEITTSDGDVIPPDELPAYFVDTQTDLRETILWSLLTQGGIALGIVGIVAAGIGWLASGRMLAPLRRVTETAQRITTAPAADRGLQQRIVLDRSATDEVKELADAFDTMLDRLDRAFSGQRRFVANASHELRTPLTVTRALVELAMRRKPDSDDIRQLGESLLETTARHEQLIKGLLLLAQSENEVVNRRPVDLAEVVNHVVAQTRDEASDAGVRVSASAHTAPVSGDPTLLERLALNLVENGIRHNTDNDGWVDVVSRTRPNASAELIVTNTGPVVPEREIDELFKPFHRLDPDRTATERGTGLGLSIARAVTNAHDGEITASSRDGGGLVVQVTLPPSSG